MEFFLEKSTENYRRYKIVSNVAAGKIVAERILDDTWNIELMSVYPERQGYGTLLLKHVMNELQHDRCNKIITHAITTASVAFFAKNGFVRDEGHTENHLVLHI